MTTGSGKVLCYQLAPLLFGQSSACIVISPLHALMIEQVQYVKYMYVIWQASIIRLINYTIWDLLLFLHKCHRDTDALRILLKGMPIL